VQAPILNARSEELIRQVESLRAEIVRQVTPEIAARLELPPDRLQSATNLLHYLALRSKDLRPLQDRLARLGLSSLGRAEPHVLAALDAVLNNLYLQGGRAPDPDSPQEVSAAFDQGAELLEQNTLNLLGPHPKKRRVRIVVTMSADAAEHYLPTHRLLESGVDCIRINCAHDNSSTWSGIIRQLRYAERATGRTCRILMDLDGPKLRTGPMEPAPAILKVRPVRAADGRVKRPANIWLAAAGAPGNAGPSADASLALAPAWLGRLAAGDQIRFRDARGSRRNWRVREVASDGCWAEADKTAYLTNGTRLQLYRDSGGNRPATKVFDLPSRESVIRVSTGDVLLLSGAEKLGRPASHGLEGELLSPGRVSLHIPEIYRDARPGEPVFFDDGRIAGIIEKIDGEQLQVRVTHTRKPVEKLAGNRGVNFPETNLALPALSAKDLEDLEFVARHADMVGLSFVNGPGDVRALRERLHALGCDDVGVVVKIETRRSFSKLPEILLEALKFRSCGVMIARGDLAVECGFERMAEVQEEILWVCEAAHLPVIWATQVLEGLIKQGHVARAEITDAAMAQSAEAVMLNKGPHIIEAVKVLDDILQRMQGHHCKKRSMLRKLHLAADLTPGRR